MNQSNEIDSNLTSILGIEISGFNEKYVEKKTVTFYKVEVISRVSQKSWTIEKRYSEFHTLHETLGKLFPNLPQIPGKTIFKMNAEEDLKKRKTALEIFLRNCVQRKDILLNSTFGEFLDLQNNAPEVVGNSVNLIYDYKKLVLGVRDMKVVPHREIMLVCCSDMNIISRTDSKITNFNFPWEKKSDAVVPLGAAFIYQCKPDKKEIYIIHKIWAQSYPSQTGVLYWEDQTETYCVGLDDGKIYVYKPVPNTHYMKMNQVVELTCHTDRVMGMALDPKTMNLYSCSTDKTFYVTDLANGLKSSALVTTGESGYTNLEYDGKNQRLFMTNEFGEVFAYSLVTFPPTLIKKIRTTSIDSIRAFQVDYINYYIFLGTVGGKIIILNLGPPGKEKLISEISSFGLGNMKLRVCQYNQNNNELITGDEDGRVTIWNLKTGKPIYLWQAHPKSPITQMKFDMQNNLLWTGGKDLTIKVWQLPEKWVSPEASKFEENEVNLLTAKIAQEKLEKTLNKKEGEEDSDDDDLNGWCFRKY